MTEPLTFLNGNLLPQSEASIALNDAGFIFGATVTDLCRTFRHRLYRWGHHVARFHRSCQSAGIYPRFTQDDITRHAHELVARNAKLLGGSDDLALVLFATPGPIGYYLGQSSAAGDEPTFGMHTFPLPFARYRPWIEQGVFLKTPSVQAIPGDCVPPHVKQRSRIHWWLAQNQMRDGAQALLLDTGGNITETASANFLLVKNGTIVSPLRESVLEGVSLKVVSELCERLGVPIEYRNISLDECYDAEEALLTCTSYCLAGVGQLNGHVYTCPGPMLRRLLETWNAEVGIDIHEQIRKAPSVLV